MESWHLADGSKLVLSTHDPEQWAARIRMQLLALGCSVEYADQRAALIRTASGSALVRADGLTRASRGS